MRLTAITACAALVTLSAPANAQRTTIVPQGMTVTANLSPGIKWGDMIFASGQLGTARGQPDSTIEGQTKQALENVKAVVEAGGSTMANVVKCTVFLVNLQDFRGMNSVYSTFFPKEPPARSTVVVAALVSASAKIEVECIAGIPKG